MARRLNSVYLTHNPRLLAQTPFPLFPQTTHITNKPLLIQTSVNKANSVCLGVRHPAHRRRKPMNLRNVQRYQGDAAPPTTTIQALPLTGLRILLRPSLIIVFCCLVMKWFTFLICILNHDRAFTTVFYISKWLNERSNLTEARAPSANHILGVEGWPRDSHSVYASVLCDGDKDSNYHFSFCCRSRHLHSHHHPPIHSIGIIVIIIINMNYESYVSDRLLKLRLWGNRRECKQDPTCMRK